MPTWLVIAIILIVGCATSAYVTARIYDTGNESEWLNIRLKNDSIEPVDIFVCKNCRQRENMNYRYCKNCGSWMKNGMGRQSYSEDIEI